MNQQQQQQPSTSMHDEGAGGNYLVTNNIGEIHSLYQDLFLTDIKKEVETAQSELKMWK